MSQQEGSRTLCLGGLIGLRQFRCNTFILKHAIMPTHLSPTDWLPLEHGNEPQQ